MSMGQMNEQGTHSVMLVDLLPHNSEIGEINPCIPAKVDETESSNDLDIQSSKTTISTLPSVSKFTCGDCKSFILKLMDPSSGIQRQYISIARDMPESGRVDLFEIQSNQTEYSSFFFFFWVVSNGDIQISTRVDPLFFVLASLEGTKKVWEPYDQFVSNIPTAVQQALEPGQLGHFCEISDKLGDDMMIYRLNCEKVLNWLVAKSNSATNVVMGHMKRAKKELRKIKSRGGEGYVIPEDLDEPQIADDPCEQHKLTPSELHEAKEAGLQLVSEYLNEHWRDQLVKALKMSEDSLLGERERNRKRKERDGEDPETKRHSKWDSDQEVNKLLQYTTGGDGKESMLDESKEMNKVNARNSQSVGLKKLAKVNTKGMKSMSSFFGVRKKNTK